MDKIKKILPWVTILLYLAIMLPLIAAKRHEIMCEGIKVKVLDETESFFIEESDVLKMLKNRQDALVGVNINDIDINEIEEILLLHPSIKIANVYRTLQGEVSVAITQRNPILRIINKRGQSFYIDDEGKIMPMSSKYTAHVLVASGNINLSYSKIKMQQKAKIGDNSVDNSNSLLLDLYELASYIYHDEFWNAQIEQIYVNKNDIELIPRVGSQVIVLGTIENYELKFRNLKALYVQGLPRSGWNTYGKINLKYNNQVICTKR